MSTDLVIQSTAYSRANLTERSEYVSRLARAGNLLPESLTTFAPAGPNGQMVKVGDPGKVLLMAETGDMLGIHPVAALTGVHIIEGKPSISANLMGGLVRRAGHRLRVSTTGSWDDGSFVARAELVRVDDPDFTFVVEWTKRRAERAGLVPAKEKANWTTYPEAMCKARAISEIIREGAPDVLMGGNVYTPEELGREVDEQGEPVEFTEVSQPGTPEDVSRETAPAAAPEPQADKPVDDKPAELPTDFDWAKAIRAVSSKKEAQDLYRKARAEGILNATVKIGRKNRVLEEALIEVGTAMADAEKAAAEPVEATVDEPDDHEGAEGPAEDPNVVDAEVVTDEPTYG